MALCVRWAVCLLPKALQERLICRWDFTYLCLSLNINVNNGIGSFVAVVILKCHFQEMVSSFGYSRDYSINHWAGKCPQTLFQEGMQGTAGCVQRSWAGV